MYYSSGNYEAFATPKKPEGIDEKSAYIVGTGLAGLAAACFLIRDAQMPGEHITLFEHLPLAGGSCDGIYDATKGFIMRGGREMDNHFECMWDLFKSIPSIVNPGETVFSEYYHLNKEDPNFSLCRVTEKQGQDAHTDRKYGLTPGAATQLLKLFMATNKSLEDKKIDDVFDNEFYATNFWTYWQTMFAFEKWHSALEMKLYLQRYIHHIDGLPDLSALRFTRYNQYESMILPMVKYLKGFGVQFHFGVQVTNVEFDCSDPKHKLAKRIDIISDTHGYLSPALLDELEGADLIIHAGDLTSEMDYEHLCTIAPVRAVLGNNDYYRDYGPDVDRLALFTYEGLKFAVAHYREDLPVGSVDVAINGHTHVTKEAQVGRCLVLNPGSASYPRGTRGPTMARMLVKDGKIISTKFIDLE